MHKLVEHKVNISVHSNGIHARFFLNSPSLLTTYRPKKPVAPNTVAAIPLEEDRPPFPLGMRAWCSFLCWTVDTETTAGEQLPIKWKGT